MRTKNIINLVVLCTTLFVFNSCKDAKNDEIENRIYLANVTTDNIKSITVPDDGTAVNLLVRMAKQAEVNTKVNVEVDENLVKDYNAKNSTGYVLLPTDFYSLHSTSVTIEKGLSDAIPLKIDIKALSPEMSKTGLSYAIPIKIASVEGSAVPVLNSASYYIYVITPTPYADVPVLKKANGIKMELAKTSVTLNDFTVEFLVKVDGLGSGRNNQILFNAADFDTGAGGTSGEIFTRFAADGAAGKWDKFQIKNQNKSYDAQTSFENNKWYHIACVNDNKVGTMTIYVNGVLDSKFPNGQISTTINSSSPRGFRFCGESDNDGYMRSNVQASEIRLWTIARTESQIKNNMYSVNPASIGLYAYWKLNEGTGNALSDATGKGNVGTIFGAPAKWLLDQKVEVGK